MKKWRHLLSLILLGAVPSYAQSLLYDPVGYLQDHCVRCHGEKKQKGGRRFESLTADFSSEENVEQWQEILDVINGGEMPPEDEAQAPAEDTKMTPLFH